MDASGGFQSWSVDPGGMGPIYPFVGSEVPLLAVCLVLWVAWIVWQLRNERAEYADATRAIREHDDPAPSGAKGSAR